MNDEGASRDGCDALLIAGCADGAEPALRDKLVREVVAPLRLDLSRTRFVWIEGAGGAVDVSPHQLDRVADALLSQPPLQLIITAGETAFRSLLSAHAWQLPKLRVAQYPQLYGLDYGRANKVQLGNREVAWFPLADPDVLLPPPARAPQDAQPCAAGWSILHSRWKYLREKRLYAPPPPPRVVKLGAHAREGRDLRLEIARLELIDQPRMGAVLEAVFIALDGPVHRGVARASFPLRGPGLAVLVETALGERLETVDEALLKRLRNRRVLADTFHGAEGTRIAWVRNLRAYPRQ